MSPVAFLHPPPARPFGAPEDLSSLGHEVKWRVATGRQEAVAAHLEGCCRQDAEYPANTVASIYFDTPDLAFLREKLSSDYLKTKVRLRWYPQAGRPSTRCFVEIKGRIGTRRSKARRALRFVAGGFDDGDGAGPMLRRQVDARAFGVDDLETVPLSALKALDLRRMPELAGLPGPLLPVLEVRYRRRRWRDPFSDQRLALDSEIRPGRIHPVVGRWSGGAHGALRSHLGRVSPTVVESKGPKAALPTCLEPIVGTFCFRSSFSKYSACFAALGIGDRRSGESL
ncbi:MAG: VTC domain-containing protein [Acidobacteriota bacterium]